MFFCFLTIGMLLPLRHASSHKHLRENSPTSIVYETREMLVPLNSNTALLCEPLSNAEDANGLRATWYKDGEAIATVTGLAHSHNVSHNAGANV